MSTSDSKAPVRLVKRVQFGILAPDEIVSLKCLLVELLSLTLFLSGNFAYRECSTLTWWYFFL